MKSTLLKTSCLALVLALGAAGGTAQARGWHGGHGGYYHRGPSGWVVGGAIGLAAAGTYLALSSQPGYAYYGPPPMYVAPAPVYVAPPVYAQPAYAAPAYAPPPPAPVSDVIAYPAHGQTVAQQGSDRVECERWAMNQSGYDPSQASRWTTPAQTDSYTRSVGACLKGRGYSIN
jgi:hypothetical protein